MNRTDPKYDETVFSRAIKQALLVLISSYFLSSPVYCEEPVFARYVRIELPGDDRVLSLAEVQVYSGEKLVSSSGKAAQASTFQNANAEKAIDGGISGVFSDGFMTHTQPGSYAWWELDLGEKRAITKLVIVNRTDCCSERLVPARVLLRNDEQQIVWRQNVESKQTRYEFDVNPASTGNLASGRNLLHNATFQQSTSPPLPDFWDIHHAAALKFKDLHGHYGIDPGAETPLPGLRALKIVNSADDFRYVILMPTKIRADLPGGDYTFSVYVKADRTSTIRLTKAWAVGQEVTRNISTEWQRLTFTFSDREGARSLQPVMYFPEKGTYYVAAPQLEEGNIATPFDAEFIGEAPQTALGRATQQLKTWIRSAINTDASSSRNPESVAAVQSMVEYDYYTTQGAARLQLSSTYPNGITADVSCANDAATKTLVFEGRVQVSAKRTVFVDVPIRDLAPGAYRCEIKTAGRDLNTAASTVEIRKLPPNPVEVRANKARRFFTLNGSPFQVIGMAVRPGEIPEWYFSDLKEHGINTVFYNRTPDRNGRFDIQNLKSVITAASKFDLKVIVGLPMAGAKPADWRQRLSAFLSLIEQLKGYPQIIGWYPVDEPSANTWQDSELLEIYRAVRQADPYRLVFINWAYDGVPKQVGQQPRGTLGATDIYGIDYYPFTAPTHNLAGFTDITTRAALTASEFNKPFFSWVQLYGGNDAWREPTGDELNYMAYVNFIYGGSIGYFDTKSNSATTWDRLRKINMQGQTLAQKLFLNEDAVQLSPPVAEGSFLYSTWKEGANMFLLVLNRDSVPRGILFDVSSLTLGTEKPVARVLFEDRDANMANARIDEKLSPYGIKVFEISPRN